MAEQFEQVYCHDCGGYDIEWMKHCKKHNTNYCRGCSCPECDDELLEYEEEDMQYQEKRYQDGVL